MGRRLTSRPEQIQGNKSCTEMRVYPGNHNSRASITRWLSTYSMREFSTTVFCLEVHSHDKCLSGCQAEPAHGVNLYWADLQDNKQAEQKVA